MLSMFFLMQFHTLPKSSCSSNRERVAEICLRHHHQTICIALDVFTAYHHAVARTGLNLVYCKSSNLLTSTFGPANLASTVALGVR